MKPENMIQWVVVAVAIGAGVFIWSRPRKIIPPPVQVVVREAPVVQAPPPAAPPIPPPPPVPESVPSNKVLVAVAPVQFVSENGTMPPGTKTLAARVWTEVNDILSRIDGVKLTRSTHPQATVTVSILDLHDERHEFTGYGIHESSVETHCSVRVEVEGASGSVEFFKTLDGEMSDAQGTVAKATTPASERQFGAIAAALKKLHTDAEFKSAVSPAKVNPASTNQTATATP